MATDINTINIYDYITPQALDALYVLEGHSKGVETPKKNDGKQDKPTTYYGMTDTGLNRIRELARKKDINIPLPAWLEKATIKGLTKEQAREAAGYLAACNTKLLDNCYNDGNYNFSRLPKEWRSAILTLAHTGGVNSWIKSLSDPKAIGSTLQAIKTGDRELIARSLMSKADGSLMDEPHNSPKRGRINRILSAVKLLYDTQANTFKDEKSRDAAYKRWGDNKFTVMNVNNHLANIYHANFLTKQQEDNMRQMAIGNKWYPPQEETPEPNNLTESNAIGQAQSEGLLTKLTNKAKNLFTNSEEKQNANNPDGNINM